MTDLRQVVARSVADKLGNMAMHPDMAAGIHADIADRVLAAIRESIGEDVRAACKAAFEPAPLGGIKIRAHEFSRTAIGLHDDAVDKLLDAWIPLITAHARDAALEEAAVIAENAEQGMDGDYCDSCHSTTYSPRAAARQIRALKGGPARG